VSDTAGSPAPRRSTTHPSRGHAEGCPPLGAPHRSRRGRWRERMNLVDAVVHSDLAEIDPRQAGRAGHLVHHEERCKRLQRGHGTPGDQRRTPLGAASSAAESLWSSDSRTEEAALGDRVVVWRVSVFRRRPGLVRSNSSRKHVGSAVPEDTIRISRWMDWTGPVPGRGDRRLEGGRSDDQPGPSSVRSSERPGSAASRPVFAARSVESTWDSTVASSATVSTGSERRPTPLNTPRT
jgi:hypothetical protein